MGGDLAEEANHIDALKVCCKAMMQLESVYTNHIPSEYARDFTRIYLIILLIPFQYELIYPGDGDNLLSRSICELIQASGVYETHLNNPTQCIEFKSLELNFLPTGRYEHEYILLIHGTVKILYVLATVWWNDLVEGNVVYEDEAEKVLSTIDILCDLLKYYKKSEFPAKDNICRILHNIQKNSQNGESLIDIIDYSFALLIYGMIQEAKWNLRIAFLK